METRERCQVKRFVLEPCQGYDPICQASLEEDDAGDFVYHADYAAMESRALAAEARIRMAAGLMCDATNLVPHTNAPTCGCRTCAAFNLLTREAQP